MLEVAKKINWFLCAQLGINPRLFMRSFIGLPKYINDYLVFKSKYKGNLRVLPCLSDYNGEGGSVKSEYFWQDLFVAQKVFRANPQIHVDIGSRIDSFVAHVASFRSIEVFDIRTISSNIPGVKFMRADLMNPVFAHTDYCDSLSCLHALEHFGLGRYGDPVDINGYKRGLENMAKLLKTDGIFYLSVPIGIERVEFNAHRIFDPLSLYKDIKDMNFELCEFSWVDYENLIHQSIDFLRDIKYLKTQKYNLGIFIFKKIAK